MPLPNFSQRCEKLDMCFFWSNTTKTQGRMRRKNGKEEEDKEERRRRRRGRGRRRRNNFFGKKKSHKGTFGIESTFAGIVKNEEGCPC